MALDDLSGGRMILGVGAGWQEREHAMFGYDLGDVPTRLARLEEGLEVVMRLIRSDEPVSFTGRFYQLREARLLPRPQRRPPILLGGNGPKRTLPLVARYADIWNGVMISAELYAERSALLDELLRAEGRQPQDIQRTLMTPVLCWRNAQELEDRVQHLRREFARFAELPTATVLDRLRGDNAGILGTPEQVVERLQQYASAGVEEVMMQWLSLDDIEGMAILAESVLPNLQD
jgi:alkanesulfonate monooxygenase SsuD/methylene tetrahydromethanopterin reductase-like flavin-dependent oxidoreductase (luciferase family)